MFFKCVKTFEKKKYMKTISEKIEAEPELSITIIWSDKDWDEWDT